MTTLDNLFPTAKTDSILPSLYSGYSIDIIKEEVVDAGIKLLRRRVIVADQRGITVYEGDPTYATDDQILIKDNHIKAAGDIQSALDNCLAYCNQQNIQIPVIVEVKNEQEFLTALKHSIVNRILIDNHSPEVLEKYIQYRNSIAPTKKLEISGGINLDNIKPYLIPGIDCISVGALTHHAISVDISLKIV